MDELVASGEYDKNERLLAQAFDDWMNQGADSPPTNGDLVEFDEIDKELLRHLARFIWNRAKET